MVMLYHQRIWRPTRSVPLTFAAATPSSPSWRHLVLPLDICLLLDTSVVAGNLRFRDKDGPHCPWVKLGVWRSCRQRPRRARQRCAKVREAGRRRVRVPAARTFARPWLHAAAVRRHEGRSAGGSPPAPPVRAWPQPAMALPCGPCRPGKPGWPSERHFVDAAGQPAYWGARPGSSNSRHPVASRFYIPR